MFNFLRKSTDDMPRQSSRLDRCAAYVRPRRKRFLVLFVIIAHITGALASVHAIMETRTPQGAVAWAVSLNTIPYLSVPLYLSFGRSKFNGYIKKRQAQFEETDPLVRGLIKQVHAQRFAVPQPISMPLQESLAKLPATIGNEVELLRNGEDIFSSIFAGIAEARDYLLVQFYIVRDDGLGRELQRQLLSAAKRGVRVHFLYDEIGCYQLPRSYLDALRQAGVAVHAFNSTQGRANRFQINFRNHRKIVIADGRQAWVGGANVGDEYMGKHPSLTPWIDAMVKVTGPAVQLVQVPFVEDWYWASGQVPELDWTLRAASSGASSAVLSLASGPADRFETCALFFLNAINTATERVWIASPYFVPDQQMLSALQLAAMRGVDVRIVVPEGGDHTLIRLAGWSFVDTLEMAGVKIFRHTKGFLHHKVMLVDSATSAIGSANFHNRSFRLNFELTLQIHDTAFAQQVEEMFLEDLADSRLSSARELEARSFAFRLTVRIARLLAPLI
jgi:cardiolipin synthase A/B